MSVLLHKGLTYQRGAAGCEDREGGVAGWGSWLDRVLAEGCHTSKALFVPAASTTSLATSHEIIVQVNLYIKKIKKYITDWKVPLL